MATIYDVAALAQVSPKTVSRVINNSELVKESTRIKVMKAIEELDFHPNAVAKSLKNQRTDTVGFVIPYGSDFVFHDPGMLEQIQGAHDVLVSQGYHMILSVPKTNPEALAQVERLMKHKNVDGLILYAMDGVEEIVHWFEEQGLKYASLGKCYPTQTHNFVEIDSPLNGYLGCKYLLSIGHCRIGFILEPSNFLVPAKEGILDGCQRAYNEREMEFPSDLVVKGDYTIDAGYEATRRLLAMEDPPTALFSSSDPMAWGALRAIRELGLVPGKDVDVLGGDNLYLTRCVESGLSALNNKLYELGVEIGKVLLNNIRGAEVPGVYLHGELVLRQTTNGRMRGTM
jgi:DNA-binding LacI/PurR family transcriptional regulator